MFFLTLRLLHIESARATLSELARIVSSCLIANIWWGLCVVVHCKVKRMWMEAAWCFVFIAASLTFSK
jgi:hypothetical protein